MATPLRYNPYRPKELGVVPPLKQFADLQLAYRPAEPREYAPGIGLIGCGGISKHHLGAYRAAGYRVLALCDLRREVADAQRSVFFPTALATDDYRRVLDMPEIKVVDITTHRIHRPPLIREALRAGKHVLSQKPFVEDLATGVELADLADACGVKLAVNQNGRWAPHFSYMRQAVAAGWLGELSSAHFRVHWDHSWVKGLTFESVRHLILYDYAIHWFDMLVTLFGERRAEAVTASFTPGPQSPVATSLFGQAMVEFAGAQATLVFDGFARHFKESATVLTGSYGTLTSRGPDESAQQLSVATPWGTWSPVLEGKWFDDGFHGAMAELLCAIEEDREPTHSARNNLRSLELCFAAVASAERHTRVVPGTVTRLEA